MSEQFALIVGLALIAGAALWMPFLTRRWPQSFAAPEDTEAPREGIRVNSYLTLPSTIEPRHILAVGGTGSGKSQIIRAAAFMARRLSAAAIVPTVEASLFEALYHPDRDVLVNPFDARSIPWSPLAEMRHVSDAGMIARALVPPAASAESEEWHGYARGILSAVLAHVWQAGGCNTDVRYLIVAAPPDYLMPVLAGSPAEALLQPGAEKMLGSARGVAGALAQPLGMFAPEAGREAWSVTEWVEEAVRCADAGKPHGWLWITAPERQRAAMMPLLSAISALAVSSILSASELEGRRIYLLADEMGSMPAIAEIELALTRGRKHGLRTIAAVQSIEQLRDSKRYGREGTASLLSCFSTQFFFRAADAESAQWVERTIGQRHVTRTMASSSESSSRRGKETNTAHSSADHHTIEPMVLASEISALPDRVAFLRLPGTSGVRRVRVDYVPLSTHAPLFIPAAPSEAKASPEATNTAEREKSYEGDEDRREREPQADKPAEAEPNALNRLIRRRAVAPRDRSLPASR